MKKKLEVEIERDGRMVIAQCLNLDEEYRGKGQLIAGYGYSLISDEAQKIGKHTSTLFVWGTNRSKDYSFDGCLFETEQEAIKYVNNITKLIDTFNSTTNLIDNLNNISSKTTNNKKIVEINLDNEGIHILDNYIVLNLAKHKDDYWILNFFRDTKPIGTFHFSNKKCSEFSIEEMNKILLQYSARIVESR